MLFSGISLRILGKARTKWEASRNQYYSANEFYFDDKKCLICPMTKETEITLSAGVHTYPFGLILPEEIPSSFNSNNGYIRYTVNATVKFRKKLNEQVRIEFIVISNVDLDDIPECKVGFGLEFDLIYS